MNWKVVIVFCIAFFVIVALVYFKVIGIDVGIVSSIASLVGIFFPIIVHLLKPKVSLEIGEPKIERREYGEHQGYKIETWAKNKGRKIVFNILASLHFAEPVGFLKVTIETRNGHRSYRVSSQPYKEDEYSWIDKEGKTLKDISLNQLRKDDSIKFVFPKETESGGFFGVGSIGRRMRTTSWAYDTLLNAETQHTYRVEITLKGEDYEKNTVTRKKTFKIEMP